MKAWSTNREEFIDWLDLPTVSEFIESTGSIGLGGVFCPSCKSENIRSSGWDSERDLRRVHICNTCERNLYRSD